MSYSLLRVMTPVIGLAVNVIFQVTGCRFLSRLSLLKSVFSGFFLGLLSVFVLDYHVYLALSSEASVFGASLITNSIIYAALGYCYFHFINLGETARRIRIIRELYDAKTGLTLEEILKRYNAKDIVQMRINRLLNNQQIVVSDGKYYIGKPLVLFMARAIVLLKLLVLGKASEFD